MRLIKYILLTTLITSCSAQWHLKTAIKKDPLILEKDTLVVMDTVVTPPVVITDTAITKQHDTIIVEKERLKVKIVKRQDTLIIDAKCDSDTIVRTIEVPYEKVVYVPQKSFLQKIQSYVFYFALILLMLLIVKWSIPKAFKS